MASFQTSAVAGLSLAFLVLFIYPVTSHKLTYVPNPNDILFVVYTRNNSLRPSIIRNRNETDLENANFNFSKPVKIYSHGWYGSYMDANSVKIKDELLKAADVNVILIDWSVVSFVNHDILLDMGPELGKFIADFLEWMAFKGMETEDLQFIGFSFGAHLAGIAGRNLNTFRIAHITACDPPGFPNIIAPLRPYNETLSDSDAEYVETIHTSTAGIGQRYPITHVEYYLDGGDYIRSCPNLACSHLKGVELYAESINRQAEHPWMGTRCADFEALVFDRCVGETIHFGGLDKKRPGIYNVIINEKKTCE